MIKTLVMILPGIAGLAASVFNLFEITPDTIIHEGTGSTFLFFWRASVLGAMSIMIGLSLLTILEYTVLYYEGKRGLLPLHILTIMVSYLGFLCMTWWEIYIRLQLNAPYTGRTLFATVFTSLGLAAICIMLYRLHYPKKYPQRS